MTHSNAPYEKLITICKIEIERIVLARIRELVTQGLEKLTLETNISSTIRAQQLANKPNYSKKRLDSFKTHIMIDFFAGIGKILEQNAYLIEEFLTFEALQQVTWSKAFDVWRDKTIELALHKKIDSIYWTLASDFCHLSKEKTLTEPKKEMSIQAKADCRSSINIGKVVLFKFGITKISISQAYVSSPQWQSLTTMHEQKQEAEYELAQTLCDNKLLASLNLSCQKEKASYTFLSPKTSFSPYIDNEVSEFMSCMSTKPVDIETNTNNECEPVELVELSWNGKSISL